MRLEEAEEPLGLKGGSPRLRELRGSVKIAVIEAGRILGRGKGGYQRLREERRETAYRDVNRGERVLEVDAMGRWGRRWCGEDTGGKNGSLRLWWWLWVGHVV